MVRRLTAAVPWLGLLLAWVAAVPAAAQPLAIVDDAGRRVVLERPARRIVLTDGMGLIGLLAVDDDPVGRLAAWNRRRLDADALAVVRAALPAIDRVPDVGDLQSGTAAIEGILASQPDLVVLDPYYHSELAIGLFEKAGIAVAVLALTPSLRDREPLQGLTRLAVLIGREPQGKAFAAFVAERLERIHARVAALPPEGRPLVLFEAHAGRGPCCMVTGAGQGIGDFVGFVGGRNLGADRIPGMAGQISAEYVIAAAPTIYIGTGGAYMASMGGLTLGPSFGEAAARASLAGVLGRTGVRETPAAGTGRAHGLWHALAISALSIVAIEAMATWTHPALFADIDPAATLDEINRRFLRVPLTGTLWLDAAPAR